MAKDNEKNKKVKRPTALKRDLQNRKRREMNRSFKASVRTAIRKFEDTLSQADAASRTESLNQVYSLMDKGVKRGVFKINKASRTKARMAARAAAKA